MWELGREVGGKPEMTGEGGKAALLSEIAEDLRVAPVDRDRRPR